MNYIGRFAPSPTGPLHRGSLVAAMASYLDARAHHGQWLVRIEDIDEPRCPPGTAEDILATLAAFGMHWDGEVVWQSRRKQLYEAAFTRLSPWVYPCGCTRREIADSRIGIASDGAAVYPGTCRHGLAPGKTARAFRVRVPDAGDPAGVITFEDRWMGTVSQPLATAVGDFVLKRADGFWAYQLAVVVDDADQGITHVVRGADLLDSTPRQIYLQRLLGMPTPAYLHVPVVTNELGEKLSKQSGALALDANAPLAELLRAARFLGLEGLEGLEALVVPAAPGVQEEALEQFWRQAVAAWCVRIGRA
ncbi:MAG TPA: tRNA glutamyl-Q(34) synthetase GluQRS [Oxalobacteraceae bacterium]|nr:tRNA glutamyl-Q(34) synthetase GluQRS [Oxalobacteraceae bacterium]